MRSNNTPSRFHFDTYHITTRPSTDRLLHYPLAPSATVHLRNSSPYFYRPQLHAGKDANADAPTTALNWDVVASSSLPSSSENTIFVTSRPLISSSIVTAAAAMVSSPVQAKSHLHYRPRRCHKAQYPSRLLLHHRSCVYHRSFTCCIPVMIRLLHMNWTWRWAL